MERVLLQAEPHPDLEAEPHLDPDRKKVVRAYRRFMLASTTMRARAEQRRARKNEFMIAVAALGSPSIASMARITGIAQPRLFDLAGGATMRASEAEALRNAIIDHVASAT